MAITDFQYFLLFALTFAFVGFLTPVMRKIAITKARDKGDWRQNKYSPNNLSRSILW
jgi:hypothetical protein